MPLKVTDMRYNKTGAVPFNCNLNKIMQTVKCIVFIKMYSYIYYIPVITSMNLNAVLNRMKWVD